MNSRLSLGRKNLFGGRLVYSLRGLGSAGSADVPANPCSTKWAWTIPTCWQWPKSLIYGTDYPAPPMPPVVGSTLPGGDPIPAVPESGDAANETIDQIIGQQSEEWKAQTGSFFQDVNTKLQSNGVPWWVWALGAGAVAVVAIGGGSPRRYGR